MSAQNHAAITEQEAGTKRCCGPFPAGAEGNIRDGRRWCVGPECMAWRWVLAFEQSDNEDELPHVATIRFIAPPTKGFCSLGAFPGPFL